MSSRRELKDAVVEAARVQVAAQRTRGHHDVGRADVVLSRSVDALDACTEPDLDALNAAVAEAVEAYLVAHPLARDPKGQPDEWIVSLWASTTTRT